MKAVCIDPAGYNLTKGRVYDIFPTNVASKSDHTFVRVVDDRDTETRTSSKRFLPCVLEDGSCAKIQASAREAPVTYTDQHMETLRQAGLLKEALRAPAVWETKVAQAPSGAHLPTDPKERKEIPLFSGLLKYFPDALCAVAHLSFVGNQQHNPGQPMHWAREKSTDQEDTILRHLLESGTVDTDGQRHSAKVAWRALAMLQLEIERDATDSSR